MANEFKVKNGLIVIGDLTTSGTITINGALAATQSWVTSQAYLTSASLSGYATQSYVTSALAALVDAAPAALDTLNELAAALGDDASFSTTITNSIASKLSLTGGTLTGALNGTSATFAGDLIINADNTFFTIDASGNKRLGFTKKFGFTPKLTFGSGNNFVVAVSSAAGIEAANTFTDLLTITPAGATTLTGALTGTSATFSGAVSVGNLRAGITNTIGWTGQGGFESITDGNFRLYNEGRNTYGNLTLGAATLSGTLTGTSATFNGDLTLSANSSYININRISTAADGLLVYKTGGSNRWLLGAWGNSNNTFYLYSYGVGGSVFSVDYSTGIATFSNNLITTNGIADPGYVRITNPEGGVSVGNSPITASIKIALPANGSFTNIMLSFTVHIYDYALGKTRTLKIAGYTYYNQDWYNMSVYQSGGELIGNINVRFGVEGGRNCVWIGETSTYWSYPNVFVTDVQCGHSQTANLTSGWNISFVTTLGTVQNTIVAYTNITTKDIGGTTNYVSKFTGATTLGNSLIFDNGTNVGIGTTSPGSKLHVISNENSDAAGAIRTTALNLTQYADYSFGGITSSYFYRIVSGTNQHISLMPGGTGNVGIGTTSPSQKLHVVGGALRVDNVGTQLALGTNGVAGAYEITTLTSNDLTIALSGVGERMRISSSGNVGIGTTSPDTPLVVQGGSAGTGGWNRTATLSATYPGLIFNSNGTKWGGMAYDYSAAMRFWVNANNNDIFAGTLAMSILNNGNVGIGTSNPIYKLQVAGSAYVNGGTLFIDSGEYLRWGNSNQGIVGVNDSHVAIVSGGATRQTIYAEGRTYFPGLDLSISNVNGSHGSGTYFRGDGGHFVFGLSSGNTLYLNYGNSAGILRTFGTWYHESTQILSTSRVLTNVSGNISMFTNDAGYLTSVSDIWVNTAGDTMTGSLLFADVADNVRLQKGSSFLNLRDPWNNTHLSNGAGGGHYFDASHFYLRTTGGGTTWLYLDGSNLNVSVEQNNYSRVYFRYNADRYSQTWYNSTTGAYWWVTTDADKLGFHRNGDGDKFYFGNTGDFYSATNGWLSTALAAKQNASTAINTSNIGSQSVSYANSAGEAGQVTNQSGQLLRYDNRTISPSETTAGYLQFGFTSWANDNSSPYADYLHMRSYTDGSGGNDNLVMFLKSGIGMRIYQQTFGSATAYSSYADVWTSANFTSTNVSNWNTAYGWGNHASSGYLTSYSETDTLQSVTSRGNSTYDRINVRGIGNQGGGNIMMGNVGEGTNKWSYLTSTHYNASSQPQGFALIGGLATSGGNAVVIGGNIYETNPATEIQFWTHGTNTHNLGGTQRGVINSAGNWGIGTSTPSKLLEVAGDIMAGTSNKIGFRYSGGDSNFYNYITANNANPLTLVGGMWTATGATEGIRFATYNGAALSILNNGNVGIGTTSPSAKLEIAGFSTGAGLKLNYGNSSGTIEAVNFIANGGANGVIGMQMVSAGVGDLWLGGSGGRTLTLYRDGNVGIGVTTPQKKLDVFGSAGIVASIGASIGVGQFAGLHFGYSESYVNNDSYKKSALVFERTESHGQGSNASGKIHFLLNNISGTSANALTDSVVTIDSDASATVGSVRMGIGTRNPSYPLDVNGTSRFSQLAYYDAYESMNFYGARGRFTNEYIHLYNKVGVGHPGGWGQGETSTPNHGLSTYGGANFAYGNNADSTFNGIVYSTASFRAPIFYDSNDTNYYGDFAGTSRFNNLYIEGAVASVYNASGYASAAIEVRERNFGGAQDDTFATAPRIGFHWAGRVAAQIAIASNGRIHILNDPGTLNEGFQAGIIYSSGYGDSTQWNTAYSWGNHASASYATTSYVTTQINNLIAGAPGVLDTLDELAAALGDDSNFATTVTNSIAGKVSKAGDTMTGNINWDTQNTGLTWNMNTDGAYIKFFNTGDGDTNSRLEYSTSDNGDEFHRWVIAGVEKMNLKWGGLTVTDTIYASGGNSGNWNTAYGWGNHASAGYALNSSLANYLPLSGGVIGGGVTINGNLTVNGTITENSSLKLKENIETSEGNLEKVVNLRPVTYNKIGSQTTELGLIAEEVAEVYPEFVQYDENGEPIGVHYSRLTAALIGAVKELTNQVQELNKKING